jgi:hypothetical protein
LNDRRTDAHDGNLGIFYKVSRFSKDPMPAPRISQDVLGHDTDTNAVSTYTVLSVTFVE